MENQEQHNKIIGAMIAVFILMTVVTTVTAIMFLTEKNKIVKQNQIANDIIRKYNSPDSKKTNPKTKTISGDVVTEEQEMNNEDVSGENPVAKMEGTIISADNSEFGGEIESDELNEIPFDESVTREMEESVKRMEEADRLNAENMTAGNEQ
mgnify:CR=1 FL=1